MNKSAYSRIREIHRMLSAGEPVNTRILQERFEVSRRTLLRDMDLLRDQLEAPIAYDPVGKTYRYTQPVWHMPSEISSDLDLLALVIGMQALTAHQGRQAAEQLFDRLRRTDSANLQSADAPDEISRRFSFRTRPARPVKPEIWDQIARTLIHRQVCRLVYQSRSGLSKFRWQSWHLANIEGEWYLFGRKTSDGPFIQLAAAHIQEVEITTEHFPIDSDFHPDQLLKNSFGRFVHGAREKTRTAILTFDTDLERYITSHQWHPAQQITRDPDGRVRLKMPFVKEDDLLYWLLSFGSAARVIEPVALRQAVEAEIRLMNENLDKKENR